MKYISVNIIVVIILFFTQSCIKKDTSDCNISTLRLSFRYTLNNKYSDLFGSEVRQVTAFIFNANGKYVGSCSKTGDELMNNYVMNIALPEDSYQVIAVCDNLNTFSTGWIDSQSNTFYKELQPGTTTISDFRVMLNSKEGPDGYLVPESLPGDLYTGYVSDALSTYDASHVTYVDLMKDTKNIQVRISGLNLLTRDVIVPKVYIAATNGRYKYNSSIDTSYKMLQYLPHKTSVVENTMNSDLKTLRLMVGYAPMLVVKHPSTGEDIFNRDITELIKSNPKYASQEDIDREDTFIFEMNISQTDHNIEISILINGWKINMVTPEND